MSCLDVMYPAYGHYAPYAKATSAFINHFQAPVCLSSPTPRCRDVLMESTGTPRGPEGVSASTKTGPSSSSSYPSTTRPEESPKEKQEVPEAEYLTSRCVLFTYYQGDISSVVDEHFSRALSSYMEAEGKRRASDLGNGKMSRHPAVAAASPPPSGTATTPPHKVAHTATPAHPPIPWTPMLPDSTRGFLNPIPTLIPTPTRQRGGATPRPRPTGPRDPSMNSTPPAAWSPTMAPCSCPPCALPTWAPSPGTTLMTWASWSPGPPGRACCPTERWPSTWMQASNITRKGRSCTGFNDSPPLPSNRHYQIQLGPLDPDH
uniref:Vestigial-like family member 2b n=1 Tax=Esox lucius TaxID=8010 RepID=A0A3P9A4Z1_ESOLU